MLSSRKGKAAVAAVLAVLCVLCAWFYYGRAQARRDLQEAKDRMAVTLAYAMEETCPPDYENFCGLESSYKQAEFQGKLWLIQEQLYAFCELEGFDRIYVDQVLYFYRDLVDTLQYTGPTAEMEAMFRDCQEYFDLMFNWYREPGDVSAPTAEELVQRLQAVDELYSKTGTDIRLKMNGFTKRFSPTAWKGPATNSDLQLNP